MASLSGSGDSAESASAAMAVEVRSLTFAYRPGAPIFQDFSWQVEEGDAWAVIGPSGCGKTTLLYLLTGLRLPQGGAVMTGGTPLTVASQSTGLILQEYGLLPWATAKENIELGLRVRGAPAAERRRTADELLERLGLSHVGHHYPGQLSGGQRQRVAIARTLALRPTLLLMDEPFSSLDALTREELQDLVVALGRETGTTTVLVTHSIEEAVFLGKKVMVLGRLPIHAGAVIENPRAWETGYRQEPEFYDRCALLRRLVYEAKNGVAPQTL